MSPEQVRCEELDARSDLFSFGLVLYEMATGRQAFSGAASGVIFSAILEHSPAPLARLNPQVPAKLEEIVINDKQLLVQDLAGGQPITIAGAKYLWGPRWTPDGLQVMFAARESDPTRSGLFVIRRTGGTARKLTSYGLYYTASPNGDSLLYGAVIWFRILRLKTAEERPFGRKFFQDAGFTWIHGADWSPRGDRIILQGTGKGESIFLALMTPDGSAVKTVWQGPEPLQSPRWNPTGDAVYYIRAKENNPELLKAAIHPQSGAVTETKVLLSGLPLGDTFAVSRDGRELAYSRIHRRSQIWLADIRDGGAKPEITTRQLTSGTQEYRYPAISPDGKWIVVATGSGSKRNLYLLPAQGGAPQQLTFLEGRNEAPAWSPDGKQIAFGSSSSGRAVVMTVPVSGGQPQVPSHRPLNQDYVLRWSADGRRIFYQLEGNRNFGVIDLATGRETDLLANESVGNILEPVVSPDGKKIAVFWNRSGASGQPDSGIWRDAAPVRRIAPQSHRPANDAGRQAHRLPGVRSRIRHLAGRELRPRRQVTASPLQSDCSPREARIPRSCENQVWLA